MPSLAIQHSSSSPRLRRHALWLAVVLVWLWMDNALAVDAALNWASLSGEQQYMLARFAPQWSKLDMAARRNLIARAEAQRLQALSAAAATGTAKAKIIASNARASSRRRRALSAAEASMSAHSFRLRRVLRELPGVSSNERRDLLERWGGLSTEQREKLVDRYMQNSDDHDELSLQQSLRDGNISNDELQRGLASGKVQAGDVKAALDSGSINTGTLKKGVASHAIVAEDLDKAMHEGDIESSDLSNAIDHNRAPSDADAVPP
jgi:hypothetical protein